MTDFWVCAHCRSLNRGRSKACYGCRAPYAPYDPATGPSAAPISAPTPATSVGSGAAPGGAFLAGASTASTADAMFGPPPTPIPTAPPESDGLGVLGGFVGGATGAVIATAVWYGVVTATHIQAGIVAIAVGWIVGQAVVLGAGRASVTLVPVSVVLTLLALVVSQYLITIQFVNEVLDADGAGIHLPIVTSPAEALGWVGDWLQYDPKTILFWGIALFESVVIPWRRSMRTPTTRWPGMPGSRPAATAPQLAGSTDPRGVDASAVPGART
jgi:hypothetical protein